MFNKIYRTFSVLKELGGKWPHPEYHIEKEPYFLFIITPSYSGSTALAKVLNSSHTTAFLRKKGEGQWLIRGMSEGDYWDPKKFIDWESVRSVWLKRVELITELTQNTEVIIEKSPPNLVRIDKLIKVFPNNSIVAFNRNPYANCSSYLRRYAKSADQRAQIVTDIAHNWVTRSNWIRKWMIKWDLPYFKYEDFCSDPAACILKINSIIPALQTVDIRKKIKVKDYKKQRIKNYNSQQISELNRQELDAISKVLNENRALLSFFGYEII